MWPVLDVFAFAYLIFAYPIRIMFQRETARFKVLKVLPLDRLCQELIDHGDFTWEEKEPKATERELQRVAYHISEQIAKMRVSGYPSTLTVDAEKMQSLILDVMAGAFFTLLNGNAASRALDGLVVGFYIGVLASMVIVVILC